MKFMVYISREGFGDFSTEDLTPGRLYEVVEPADAHEMVRVIDDSGESYLYPATLFAPVELSTAAAARLHDVLLPA